MGDHAEKIAQQAVGTASEEKPPTVAEMQDLSLHAVEMLKRAVEAFFMQDITMANTVIDESKSVVEAGANCCPGCRGPGARAP